MMYIMYNISYIMVYKLSYDTLILKIQKLAELNSCQDVDFSR